MNQFNYSSVLCSLLFFIPVMSFAGHEVSAGIESKVSIREIEKDSLKKDSSQPSTFVAIPIVYYTPETRWAFGVGAVYTFFPQSQRDGYRPSQFQLGAVYTLENQLLLYLPWTIYWGRDKHRFQGEIGYYDYFYRYFGLGSATEIADKESYTAVYNRIFGDYQYQFFPNLYLGVKVFMDYYYDVGYENTGELRFTDFPDVNGGTILREGFSLRYDSRDNIYYPKSGEFIQSEILFSAESLGSVSDYMTFDVDIAAYRSWHDFILAGNIFYEGRYGNIPLNDMAILGGSNRLRGYYKGRFRGKQAAGYQVELRKMIWWRLGLSAFYSQGTVIDKGLNGAWPWSYGGGIRFTVDKENKLNLRVEYAIGEDNTGFYFTVGEAF